MAWLFMFLIVSFEEKKISILMKFNLFLKNISCFHCCIKEMFAKPKVPKVFLCLLLQKIFPLTLSMTIFYTIFLFRMWLCNYSSTLCWKDHPSSIKTVLVPLSKRNCVCLVYFYTLYSVDLLVYFNTNITLSVFL